MEGTITINLSEEIASALEEATGEEGVSQAEVIPKAIADYLFICKCHSLRERLMAIEGMNTR